MRVLKEVVDLMERNTTLVRRLQELQRDPNRVRGQMYFSRALDLHQQGQYEQEREALALALRNDGINADILIAMFRVPAAPEDWQKQTRDQIDRLAERFARPSCWPNVTTKWFPTTTAAINWR